ncbi:hypothetical protein [Streptomyces sp. NPDC096033]|uniref:hypothetical protein n=1 Tax=Streptomyces sp. NPDC096033 TaxID=3366071 RepID=UPI00380F4E46
MASGVIAFILICAVLGIIAAAQSADGLQRKFQSLGDTSGKTKDEIIAVVGQANSYAPLEDGAYLLQWVQGGYHIAIVFGPDHLFIGINGETSL